MVNYTKQQRKAIEDRGKDILVSASAGSGKTAVLVERVIQKILNGTPISKLLIITFTKAAASEMKEKIKLQLNKRLEEEPKNTFLRSQLIEIDAANISTIDSFCLDIIRRFYYVIDLDPSFSVLTDETQATLMEERALKTVQDEYLEKNDQNFLAFYDNFAGDREADGVHELLLNLYDVAMTQPNYQKFLQELPKFYDFGKSITSSFLWKSTIKVLLLQKTQKINKEVLDLIDQAQVYSKNFTKVIKQLSIFNDNLKYFINLLEKDTSYDDLREAFKGLTFIQASKTGKKTDEDYEEVEAVNDKIKAFREGTKKELTELYGQYFVVNEQEQLNVLKKAQRIVQTISEVELKFINKFGELKRNQNLLDYRDMEQFANEILSQDTSNSDLAKKYYQDKFDEILIDEYQDVNDLQESIVQAIKKKGHNTLFMVGDVKQSIYGFRQAQPDLFLEKYDNFANEADSSVERIILSDNFRSSKTVVNSVNKLFNTLLTKDFGGINYEKEAQLIHGAKFDEENSLGTATELLFSYKKPNKKNTYFEEIETDTNQTQIIIKRIKQLKKEGFEVWDDEEKKMRLLEYSDIAILTRTHSNNLQIMQEFAKTDIPLFITDAQNYFQTFELVMIMNYLRIIDNPRQDIPLVSVLRSPIFNFTEPDLAQIRVNSRNTDFFDAVVKSSSLLSELGEKCKNFLNQLEEFRQFATNHRISELIWSIYETTHLLEIVTGLPNGQQRRINLQALYERANSYESAGFKGLYQFINFIERMRKNQKDLAQPLLSDQADNAVKLMTIHSSKGLEFPVVFVVDLDHHYQKRDLSGDYTISSKLGLGITVREDKYKIDTLLKGAIKSEKERKLLEEEARILYVALTRARQKLIMVGEVPEKDGEINFSPELDISDKLSAVSAWSFLKHQLNISGHTTQTIDEMNLDLEKQNKIYYLRYDEDNKNEEVKEQTTQNTETNAHITNKVKKLYNFVYPFEDATKTTAYQAVSEIKSAFNDPLDTELENAHLIPSTNRYLQPIDGTPTFLKEKSFTGAEIGTATHLLLQYYNYRGSKDEKNLQEEIQKLIEIQKLNPDIIPSLNQEAINWFVMSDFAKPFWQNPDKLYRESEFSSLVNVNQIFNQFSDPADKILVHGTIDGYFEDSDGIILFDYKTDYVDKTNLEQSIAKIRQKYSGQLRLYELAINNMTNLKVKSKYLVLLDAQKLVKLD
ncbi:helicase-exonuclease AddAB subunit AddA [Lactobacillus sp.]|uniref:helicase-exonuclease AddAB subunit AddA n=1 Tax=Lactobacillus sp. TaxID=1591 RepID=UPI0019A17467|nr:helicase-exonuclease AddAB subunit AddA [Lactobacillus sp.]MBD5429370.1 helicase-exonuclease AddAB subunit AddA [Lactobacillus sp.]